MKGKKYSETDTIDFDKTTFMEVMVSKYASQIKAANANALKLKNPLVTLHAISEILFETNHSLLQIEKLNRTCEKEMSKPRILDA